MFKFPFVAALAFSVLLVLGSCTAEISPAGRKQKTIQHFTSLRDHRSMTKEPIYKRYMKYNKKRVNKFKPVEMDKRGPGGGRRAHRAESGSNGAFAFSKQGW
jgi:hypothetical protein